MTEPHGHGVDRQCEQRRDRREGIVEVAPRDPLIDAETLGRVDLHEPIEIERPPAKHRDRDVACHQRVPRGRLTKVRVVDDEEQAEERHAPRSWACQRRHAQLSVSLERAARRRTRGRPP